MKTPAQLLPRVCLALFFAAISLTPAVAVVFTTDTSIGALDTSYDGQDVVVSNCTVTIDGGHAFNSLRLATGGTLTHTASSNGLSLTLTNDLQVESGGAINLAGRGFDGNTGTGNGGEAGSPQSGAGAGHGGYGGLSSSNALGGNCYGVFDQPITLGSGGGQGATSIGGAGGGAIKLVIGGSALIEGVISANGANATNSRSGGGSGGSVWITAQTVSGAGTITANGGNGEPIHGGGGGGGRIAIHSDTNNFTGVATAFGGLGWKAGGAGTVYTKPTTSSGLLRVDNGGSAGTNTLIGITSSDNVLISGRASVVPFGNWTAASVTISSNSTLLPPVSGQLFITTSGNITVEPTGIILASGAGSASGSGSGAGQHISGGSSGAGHGGRGASVMLGAFSSTGGAEYGSMTAPILAGSGGGGLSGAGGRGGGAVRLAVGGRLAVNGLIAVNATSATTANAGGGSGGSVYIITQGFEGGGDIQANGGNGHITGGGGGGGRIAIYFASNSFTGVIQATGGNATTNVGGAGTIYLKPAPSLGNLIVDNGGFQGATTSSGATAYDSVTVQGGGKLVGGASFLSRNLTIKSNSWLVGLTSSTMTLTITGHVSIEHMAGINMNGVSAGGAGNGNSTAVSGGSYGGSGGSMFGSSTAITYGSTSQPNSAGSIGGSYFFGGNIPYGGGVIVVSGGGTMQLDGLISADGIMAPPGLATSNGTITHSPNGGGSGGSVRLNVRSLAGTGSISANGGDGVGGGGGGGRIAIYCNTNTLTGPITAYGGGALPGHPNYPGGAGTIYFNSYSGNTATGFVLVDNGGQLGGFTSMANATPPGVFNGVVTNGANFSTTHSFSNLTVYPNSSIISSPINASNLTGV